MRFAAGDYVHVARFGKGVVREVRNGGRYVVELKGRSMVAVESQLTGVDERKARRGEVTAPACDEGLAALARQHAAVSIDLHGMTSEEAIKAVDEFLNDAILDAHEEVRIIHGRSGGRLKAAVHARLRSLPSVRGFRVDERNPGVTIVAL
jgi:DNA mismatch repair protein MutS2